jgi:hypothetical protein
VVILTIILPPAYWAEFKSSTSVKRFEFAAGATVSLFVVMWLRDISKHGAKAYTDSMQSFVAVVLKPRDASC